VGKHHRHVADMNTVTKLGP